MRLNILYEDADIIVVVKHAGVESQASRGFGDDMVSLLKKYLSTKGEGIYVGVIHRLDKPVSGIMVFSKNENATKALNKGVSERNISKEYMAILCGKPVEKLGKLRDFIHKDVENSVAKLGKEGDKHSKEAVLEYEVLESKCIGEREYSLVKIKLLTGRFHQIRIQFASRGLSLVGDKKYNPLYQERGVELIKGDRNIALASIKLGFKHPRSGKYMEFIGYPEAEIWKNFTFFTAMK